MSPGIGDFRARAGGLAGDSEARGMGSRRGVRGLAEGVGVVVCGGGGRAMEGDLRGGVEVW